MASHTRIFSKALRERLVDLWNERCPKTAGAQDLSYTYYLRVGLAKTLYGREFAVVTAAGELRFSVSVTDTSIFLARRFEGSRDPAVNARMMKIADVLINRHEGFHREVPPSGKSNHYLFARDGDNADPDMALRWLTHQIDTIDAIAKSPAPEIT